MGEKCPHCGQEHGAWEPNEDIQRDLAAMVALVLSDEEATLKEFAILLGDTSRAPALLLHAVQTIAYQGMAFANLNGEEDPRAAVLEFLRESLLHHAEGGDHEDEG